MLCGQHFTITMITFAKQVVLTNKSRQGTLSGVWSAQPGCLPTGRRTGLPKIKLSMKTDLSRYLARKMFPPRAQPQVKGVEWIVAAVYGGLGD